jgi:uncharacterized protein YkwD
MRRSARALAAVAVTAALSAVALVGPAATPASAHVGTDARLTEFLMAISINGVRAQHGLPPLHFDGALSDSARAWSADMASRRTLAHSRNLASTVSGPWSAVAENVGAGPHPPAIQDYFLSSPIHRANILGNYTRMGIGVVVDRAGTVWVTQRFVR